ncbi:putative membrane protein [Collimonas arenae]|uniref:Putative membrane protein n=1 Tax=Collimonas arenae TaxID=279058 RepID=A0A0A1FJJ1_9BURK|nr:DoxX family protein [Collimonas arenae]AIY43809.1 putative membrane protein [Collimonas arenae]
MNTTNTTTHTDTSMYAATLLRLTLGIALLAHAYLKVFVFTFPGAAAFFASQGFPAWSVYPVVAIEVLTGLAMVLGLQARIAAIISLPVLLGALSVHAPNGWVFTSPNGGWEFPAFMIVTALSVALLGNGVFAIGNARAGK